MAISRVGSAPTVARAAAASVTPTWAASQNRTANNLLVCWAYATGSGSNTLTNSDNTWTAVGADVVTQTTRRVNMWYKYAAGTDAAPTISCTSGSKTIAFLDEFTGNDTTGPFFRGTNTAASGSTLTFTLSQAPGVDGMALTCYGVHCTSSAATETADTNWTQDAFGLTSSDNAHLGGDYYISPPTGTATAELVTINTATPDAWVGLIVFFKTASSAHTQSVSGSLTFTGAQVRATATGKTGALTFTGSALRATGAIKTAALTFAGSAGRAVAATKTAATTFVGSAIRATAATKAAALSFVSARAAATGHALAATWTATGSLAGAVAKAMTGALSFTGLASTGNIFSRALSASVSFAGSSRRAVGKGLAAATTPTSAVHLAVGKFVGATQGFSGAVGRAFRIALSGALAFIGRVRNGTVNAPVFRVTARAVPWLSVGSTTSWTATSLSNTWDAREA